MKPISKLASKILLIVLFVTAIAAGVTWNYFQGAGGKEVSFAEMERLIASHSGDALLLKETADGELSISINNQSYITMVRPQSTLVDDLVQKYNISYQYKTANSVGGWVISGLLLTAMLTLFILHKKGKLNIGASGMKHQASKATPLPDITLDDIGGIPPEMKDEISQTLEIFKNPKVAKEMNIELPKGILLYGPPGTGKTLLAQAMAKEIGATFYSSSGAAFTELFVGVGASRVRTLFQNARKQTPAVIFIDEVDALAAKRKEHGGDEAEKTLTELLVQLDGGQDNDGILFIAATNRKDLLDDAFLRPGRIDFTFNVQLPDTKGRREIIDIHTNGKTLAPNVAASLDTLAESTSGFSGAEISGLFETASRRAIREGRTLIEKHDLDFAIDRTILGNTARTLNDQETKRRVAIHESGHALIAAITKPGSVRKATIIPRGQALGYVAPIQKELHLSTASELLDQVSMILAGGIAERLYLGEHSIGVSGDVEQAKDILERMVNTGIFQDGFSLIFNKAEKEEKMQMLFNQAAQKTETLLTEHAYQFEELVNALYKEETLEGTEVQRIVELPTPKEAVVFI
ncbi:AAA family ATPase [Sporosarcina sp. PTS2304]|uniref:AAA family ATPase n=1 Tax=Sporosarcina sp. PTS2304 TaxID=2283194 RepID=UPI000E0D3923|nr:AAA family ATPase [Sporosarcina sp. PTS2304]AXH99971.1 AAA family ATPase [Sporosarcina sp. PTS2304]